MVKSRKTLYECIDAVTEWADKEICQHITLKLPDEIDEQTGLSKMKLVHPAAFSMFVPGKDHLPPSIPAPAPSVVVQVMDGEDRIRDGVRILKIRMSFCTWNPGIHVQEIMTPEESESSIGRTYRRISAINQNEYRQTMDGWKDAYLFIDTALRTIETREYIGQMRIVFDDEIKFGPFKTEGMIWDQYPYWSAYISFSLEIANLRFPSTAISELL